VTSRLGTGKSVTFFYSVTFIVMLWCRSVVERVMDVESSFQSGSFKVRAGVDSQLDEKRRLHNSLPLLLDSISRHQLSPGIFPLITCAEGSFV
jgi:hypothetical protein